MNLILKSINRSVCLLEIYTQDCMMKGTEFSIHNSVLDMLVKRDFQQALYVKHMSFVDVFILLNHIHFCLSCAFIWIQLVVALLILVCKIMITVLYQGLVVNQNLRRII